MRRNSGTIDHRRSISVYRVFFYGFAILTGCLASVRAQTYCGCNQQCLSQAAQAVTNQVELTNFLLLNDGCLPIPVLRAYLSRLTDEALLAKYAIRGHNQAEVLSRLKTQSVIAGVLLEEMSGLACGSSAGEYAPLIEKLTDQAILADLVHRSNCSKALFLKQVTDQGLLRSLAQGSHEVPGTRAAAASMLANQELVAEIAVKDPDEYVRDTALRSLKDDRLAAKLVMDTTVPLGSKLIALSGRASLPGAELSRLAGNLDEPARNSLERYARIRLALANPIIVQQAPDLVLDFRSSISSASYGTGTPVYCMEVTFNLVRQSKVMASQQGKCNFGSIVELPLQRSYPDWVAPTNLNKLMVDLFAATGISEEDLAKLAESEIDEVRAAAMGSFRNGFWLEKIASKNWKNRKRALDAMATLVNSMVDDSTIEKFRSAVTNGRLEDIETLLTKYPVLIHDRVRDRGTPLHDAAASGNRQAVELLLAKGAFVDAMDNQDGGRTPLFWADKGDIAELLLSRGANVNAVSHGGETALYSAACNGLNRELAESLLSHGADVNAKAWDGKAVLQCTEGRTGNPTGRAAILKLLHQYGARRENP